MNQPAEGAHSPMIRAAIVTGGAQPRIAEWPFLYLDKNFVTMLGGVEATLATVAPSTATVVIQVRDAAQALAAGRGGADIVFVDTGRWGDAAAADRALREAGLRAHRLLAFGGGVVLEDLPRLCNVGVDIVDVGRPIVDAPLLDMGVRVIAR